MSYPARAEGLVNRIMLSVTIVNLKILTRSLCNCLLYEKVIIMARGKELSNSQKAPIVNLSKNRESYRNISSNLNIPFTAISLFIARFKRRNTAENKNKKRTGAPRKTSLRLSRILERLINQNSMVTKSCKNICIHQDVVWPNEQ